MRAFRHKIRALKKHTGVTHNRHHRKPVSNGGNDDPSNISLVPKFQHDCWHSLFSNMTPQAIALVINDKWISSEYKFVCVPSDSDVVIIKK